MKYILKEETIDKGLNILNENIFEWRKYFARRHLKGRIICLKIILQGGNNNEKINVNMLKRKNILEGDIPREII